MWATQSNQWIYVGRTQIRFSEVVFVHTIIPSTDWINVEEKIMNVFLAKHETMHRCTKISSQEKYSWNETKPGTTTKMKNEEKKTSV